MLSAAYILACVPMHVILLHYYNINKFLIYDQVTWVNFKFKICCYLLAECNFLRLSFSVVLQIRCLLTYVRVLCFYGLYSYMSVCLFIRHLNFYFVLISQLIFRVFVNTSICLFSICLSTFLGIRLFLSRMRKLFYIHTRNEFRCMLWDYGILL